MRPKKRKTPAFLHLRGQFSEMFSSEIKSMVKFEVIKNLIFTHMRSSAFINWRCLNQIVCHDIL